MKNKIKTIFSFTILFATLMSTSVFANTELNFQGVFRPMYNFFDGDYFSNDDFDIDGYYVDTNGEQIALTSNKVAILGRANINYQKVNYGTAFGHGSVDVTVIPFNSKVVSDDFSIPDMKPELMYTLESFKSLTIGHAYQNLNKIKFTNANGKILKIDSNSLEVDASSIQLKNGKYTIYYTCGFFNNNAFESNQYDKISGSFNVVINDGKDKVTVFKDLTTSLTANELQLSDIGLSYVISINNKNEEATYQFTSSNTSIISVNSKSGLVTSKSKGNAKITCKETLSNGKVNNYVVDVLVGTEEGNPSLNYEYLNLGLGENFDLDVNNQIKNSLYKYKSNNSDIVSVKTLTGKGVAVDLGKTYITCTITTPTKKVLVLKCDVTVTE